MKKFKKVFALMLALACIFSLSITAFADDATIDYTKTGTLNIYKYDMTSATGFEINRPFTVVYICVTGNLPFTASYISFVADKIHIRICRIYLEMVHKI